MKHLKISNKSRALLFFLPVVFAFVAIAGWNSKASAATNANFYPGSPDVIKNATFEFQDRATIIAHFTRPGGTVVDVTYKDANTHDGNYRYKEAGQSLWCGEGKGGGIYFDGKNGADSIQWDTPVGATSFTAHIDIDYASSISGNKLSCVNKPDTFTKDVSSAGSIYKYYSWSGVNLNPNSAAMGSGGLPINSTFKPTPDYLSNPVGIPGVLVSDDNTCPKAIITTNGGGNGTIYETAGFVVGAGTDVSKYVKSWPSGKCEVSSINFSSESGDINASFDSLAHNVFSIAGTPPSSGNNSSVVNPPAGGTNDSSACAFKTNSDGIDVGLEWVICPVVTGLSKSADAMNKFVDAQLNFSIHENLSPSVKNAWVVFKDLASALIVILMLVMVFSQAFGGGIFDAYTFRKMLPRLVVAVIIMQISWYVCIYAITLANDAGQGIAQLMAAPFGGAGNLDLPSLLHRLSPTWAGIIGVGTTTVLITSIVFSGAILAYGWPILLLAVIMLVLAILVALATLLFRNALIVLLVILSPLAFLAWVLPGTQNYWKIWKDNFTKLLIFFPLVMAMIYAGRIFAWTAGNLGGAGGLDVIMVLVGFFGPYFLLPKSFKWGGSFLSSASNAIENSWPVKKGREVAKRDLTARQSLNTNLWGKTNFDPDKDPRYTKATKKWKGIPLGYTGSLGHTIKANALSGRFTPGGRSMAIAMQKQNKASGEEDAIRLERVKRFAETAEKRGGIKGYLLRSNDEDEDIGVDGNGRQLSKDELARNVKPSRIMKPGEEWVEEVDFPSGQRGGTSAKKIAYVNLMGHSDPKIAAMAMDTFLREQSFPEMRNRLVEINPKDEQLMKQLRNRGSEIFRMGGKVFIRPHEHPRMAETIDQKEGLYPIMQGKFVYGAPHIGDSHSQGFDAPYNEPTLPDGKPNPRYLEPQTARMLDTIKNYLDAGTLPNQSETMLAEIQRIARKGSSKGDPRVANEFANLLRGYASGSIDGDRALGALHSGISGRAVINGTLELANVPNDPQIMEIVQSKDPLQALIVESKRNQNVARQAPAAPQSGPPPDDNPPSAATASPRPTPPPGPSEAGQSAQGIPNSARGGSGELFTGAGGGAPTGAVEVRISDESAGKIGSAFAEKVRPVFKSEIGKAFEKSDIGKSSGDKWGSGPQYPPEPLPPQSPPSPPPPPPTQEDK